MAGNDSRYYETFYGVHLDDWTVDWGTFADHHKFLTEEYLSDGCSCATSSSATNTHKFLYPEHLKKDYFIEGTIKGHVTFAASGATSYICAYRVTVCKMHEDTTDSELFTTGWRTVNKTLTWDSTYDIGEEIVFPFRIDAWEKEHLTEYERFYLKVESTCSDNSGCSSCTDSECDDTVLWHSNDATWQDIKIEIPFLL